MDEAERSLRRARRRGGICHETAAQATLEYALTVLALLAIVSALGLLWRAGQDGTLAQLVEAASSHGFDAGGLIDISLY